MRPFASALLVVGCWLAPGAVQAQDWPQETPTLAGGRIAVGGELTVTVAPDDEGEFNVTDYSGNALQLVRVALSASVRPVDPLTLVAEVRAEGDTTGGPWSALPTALYLRVRPWRDRPIDLQIGRIPPVFGAAGRRVYAHNQVLIGYPLNWQYLTVLRPDSVPSTADELLSARGSYYGYSVGADGYARGVPLATAFRYDTGAEVRFGDERSPVSMSAALTAGTLSRPGMRDSNGGPQVSARAAFRPVMGLVAGVSFAEGRFLARQVKDSLPAASRERRYAQRTWGADVEYSRGYWLVRGELVSARWRLPALEAPRLDQPLRATGVTLEGQYRLTPRLTAAARVDRLSFSRVRGTYVEMPWDAPVTRVEAGVAFKLTRQLIARTSLQVNRRDRGGVRRAVVPTAQVTWWF